MGSVWKRLNRINKRASKYKFTASYQELYLESGPSWQPTALSVVWTRRGRRIVAEPVSWEPTMKSPYIGMCVWPVPENKEITVTLFRDQRQEEYDNKDWFFILEDVKDGKRKPVAQGRLNLKDYARQIPHQENLKVKLRPLNKKVTACYLVFTITSEFLKEGKAMDDDMRSLASLVSNSTIPNDIADMETLEEDEEEQEPSEVKVSVSEFQSLTKSIQSMSEKLDNLNPGLVPVRTLTQQDESYTRSSAPHSSNQTYSDYTNSERRIVSTSKIMNQENIKFKETETSETKSNFTLQLKSFNLKETETFTESSSLLNQTNSSSSSNNISIIPARAREITPSRAQPTSIIPVREREMTPGRAQPTSLIPAREMTPGISSTTTIKEEILKTPVNNPPVAIFSSTPANELVIDAARNDTETSNNRVGSVGVEFEESISFTEEKLEPVDSTSPEFTTRVVSQETRTRKFQKTQSQELRDFTQEFLQSTTVDFDPMSFEDHTPTVLRSSMRRPELRKETITEEPEKPSPARVEEKIEIVPSQSFLNSLNSGSSKESTPDETKLFRTPGRLTNSETSPVPLSSFSQPSKPDSGSTTGQQDLKPGSGVSSDLLEWTKSILCNYKNVKVTNFTSSWRNGLAFCALIHSFYPTLIQYSELTSNDIKINCKLAFEAGEKLGIPRVLEPENMVIRRIPDKLAVITYLHQLRSCLGTAETNALYENSKMNGDSVNFSSGIRKSFSDGNIKLFSRTSSADTDRPATDLPTVMEEENGDVSSKPVSKYRQKAKDLMAAARRESVEKCDSISPERENTSPNVIMRQKSTTPKPKKDNRLSFIDNEMSLLDAEQQEIDLQAAILDKRLREVAEDDQLLYDALLQQWFTLVNKKNALLRRQMQLNILEKEDDLQKKSNMLQEELRKYSDMEERRKTDEDRQREELLLQELVLVVNQRNELVQQRDEEERMIDNDEQIEQDVTLAEDRLVQNRGGRDDCKMQ